MPLEATVRRVVDGDTIELMDGRLVRYIGIDAPEVRRREGERWVMDPEPFGLAATEANKRLVEGKWVRFGQIGAVELKKNHRRADTTSQVTITRTGPRTNYEVLLLSKDGRRLTVAGTRDERDADEAYGVAFPLAAEVARICGRELRLVE